MRQARQGLLGGVCVDRAQTAEMARVQRLQQVERLSAAHLADEDAIRPMTKRGPEQVGDGHRRQWRSCPQRRLSAPGLEPKDVRFVQVNLRRLLD